jgi:hypothetical protein
MRVPRRLVARVLIASVLYTTLPAATALATVRRNPKRVQLANNRAGDHVEMLVGAAALAHIDGLRTAHPSAWQKAEKLLRERGYRPTEHAVVLHTAPNGVLASVRRGKIFRTEDSASTSEGELVMWSWDDGDPGRRHQHH